MRRISDAEREERGLPGPAMAVCFIVGLVAAAGLACYGAAFLLFKLAEWVRG